jgi:hypothetical protein
MAGPFLNAFPLLRHQMRGPVKQDENLKAAARPLHPTPASASGTRHILPDLSYMPRYFFNVFHERAQPDSVGEELADAMRHGKKRP